jgi:hypothetical protein
MIKNTYFNIKYTPLWILKTMIKNASNIKIYEECKHHDLHSECNFFYKNSNAWARVPEAARWCTRPHVQCTATAVRSKINICDCPATRYVLNLL